MSKNLNFFFTLLFLSISMTGFSQAEFGLTGGVNAAKMDYTTGIEFDNFSLSELAEETSVLYNSLEGARYKPGAHFGIYGLFDLGVLSFNPSLLYSNGGLKTDTYSTNLNYLSAPLLVGLQPFDLLHIQFGPQFGYLVGAKIKPDGRDAYSLYDTDYYNKLDVGAVLGIMIDLPNAISLYGRYHHGLGSVYEPVPVNDKEFKFQNRTFQVGVNVALHRGGEKVERF